MSIRHQKRPNIPCPNCKGQGEVCLGDELARVLWLFTHPRIRLHAGKVLELIKEEVSVTAMNNRLERLRKLDLLQRHRVGRAWHYSKKATK